MSSRVGSSLEREKEKPFAKTHALGTHEVLENTGLFFVTPRPNDMRSSMKFLLFFFYSFLFLLLIPQCDILSRTFYLVFSLCHDHHLLMDIGAGRQKRKVKKMAIRCKGFWVLPHQQRGVSFSSLLTLFFFSLFHAIIGTALVWFGHLGILTPGIRGCFRIANHIVVSCRVSSKFSGLFSLSFILIMARFVDFIFIFIILTAHSLAFTMVLLDI